VRALPSDIEGDAAGEIDATSWDEAAEPYAQRVIDKLDRYAPGIEDIIIDREVFTPDDIEQSNPNLVGGDSIAGSHHLRQNFMWRPFVDWQNYETPLDDLYMVGAGTWPGGGVNALSGYLAAQKLTAEETPVDQVRDRAVSALTKLGTRL
jgi:phytoene dehydrogenase-like protein